jgi:hypothetical protein
VTQRDGSAVPKTRHRGFLRSYPYRTDITGRAIR